MIPKSVPVLHSAGTILTLELAHWKRVQSWQKLNGCWEHKEQQSSGAHNPGAASRNPDQVSAPSQSKILTRHRSGATRTILLQERALRITMGDPTADDATAATAAAALSCDDSNVSPATLLDFAQRFAERGQHAAAAHAFVGAGRALDALEILEMHDVPLDEEFADKIAPSERGGNAASGECPIFDFVPIGKPVGNNVE